MTHEGVMDTFISYLGEKWWGFLYVIFLENILPSVSLTDLSCIILFGACIEGVILRDK